MYKKVLVIPDTQVRPGVNLDHFIALGNYVVAKKPDIICHIGDHFDLPSLNSYMEGKAGFENADYQNDIDAGNLALELFQVPIRSYNKGKRNKYEPQKIFCLGNHEDRITRFVAESGSHKFRSIISHKDFLLDDWKVMPFLTPVRVGPVWFAHYFRNENSPRPIGGNANYKLTKLKFSYVVGHIQEMDVAVQYLANGSVIRGLMAGTFYAHEEAYLGKQKRYWRGVHILHEFGGPNVYTHSECSLGYLLKEYF